MSSEPSVRCVHVDEAGQAGVILELEQWQVAGDLDRPRHGHDAAAVNDHRDVSIGLVGDAVDERSAMDGE